MGGVGTLARVLREAIEDQGLHSLADLRAHLARRSRSLGNVLVCDLYGVAREGLLARGSVVEGRAERVDVALWRDPLPAQLLRRGVGRRPEVGAGTVVARGPIQGPGDAEVRQLGTAPLVHEDVAGLDVAVNDAPLVGVGEPRGDVGPDPREQILREWPAPVHQVFEVSAGDVLHYDVGDLAPVELVLARVEDPDHVGVGEPGRGASLTPKAQAGLRVVWVGFYDLYGDGAVEYLVAAEEDTGHPAGAELAHEHEPVPEADHGASGTHARD